MRTRILVRTTQSVLALVLVLAVALPVAAHAADGLPDEITDPAPVLQPEEPVVEAVDPQPQPQPEPQPDRDDVTTLGGDGAIAEIDGGVVGGAGAPRPAAAVAPATAFPSVAPAGSGSLPFTGLDSGQIVLLFLVGSLLVSAGTVAWAYGRVGIDAR